MMRLNWTKPPARRLQNLIDLFLLSGAYWGGFLLRFDGDLPLLMWKRLLFTWPYVVAFEFALLAAFKVPKFSWRHIGLREAVRVAWATCLIAAILLTLRGLSEIAMRSYSAYAIYALIPVGVIVGNFVLSLVGLVGIRCLWRAVFERGSKHRLTNPQVEQVRTLLVGAGQAGALVAREIEKRPDLGIKLLGFLDDNESKRGMLLHGLRVWGTVEQLSTVASMLRASQVIVAIAELAPDGLRRIVRHCESERLRVKIVPGLYQVIDSQAGVLGRPRDVSIEDLLGREAVNLDMGLVGSFLRGKRVLITGAGGSIGSELVRQVVKFHPERVILVERSEYALFTIHSEISRVEGCEILPRVCDVCDQERLDEVFRSDRPQVVFHAAAHKHVPMMELNPGEALKNNVFGTKAVADAAGQHGCEAFVLISTDKAVNPTSVMGATKRVAEMYVQALSNRSKTKYVAVRFGNVLGSTGSVIPTFKAQIAAGGPVTVTHPEMKRYFMTIPEAAQLVMQAGAMGAGGEILVLDMGEPVKIVDLAHDLIRLSGLVPEVDIETRFVGMRPGEKLFEELGFDAERMSKTAHPKIYVGSLLPSQLDVVERKLALLTKVVSGSRNEVRATLRRVLPEMLEPAPGPLQDAIPTRGEAEGVAPGFSVQSQLAVSTAR